MSTVIRIGEGPDENLAYWEVGHYGPDGTFHPVYFTSDWEEASSTCSELNGGIGMRLRDVMKIASDLIDAVNDIGYRINNLTDSVPCYYDELEKIASKIGGVE